MSLDQLPTWFQDYLTAAGNDSATWADATIDYDAVLSTYPQFIRDMFTIAIADSSAWYNSGSSTGSMNGIPDYYRDIFFSIGSGWASAGVVIPETWALFSTSGTPGNARYLYAGQGGRETFLHIAGGFDTAYRTTHNVLDLDTGVYSAKASIPTGPRAFHGDVAAQYLGQWYYYVFGGYDGLTSNGLLSVYRYDPVGNSWAAQASLPTGISAGDRFAGACWDGGDKIYVHRGVQFNRFNMSAGNWTALSNHADQSGYAALGFYADGGVSGYVYAVAGGTSTPTIRNVWRYDVDAGTWTDTGVARPTFSYGFGYFTYDNKLFLIGGIGPADRDEVWYFDFTNETFTQLTDMDTGHFAGTACVYNSKFYYSHGYTYPPGGPSTLTNAAYEAT